MHWTDIDTANCSVQATLDVVGNKWSLLVMRELFNGVRRFDDMRRHLGVSEAVLARRLRELTAEGVIATRPYQDTGARTRHEYVPTQAGWDLFPVVVALLQWGDRHRAGPDGPSWLVTHRDCGHAVSVHVACRKHPGEPLDHRQTTTGPGPSARPRS
jgi:DNA-binding HxlR family transcriptional regulator